MSTAGLNPPDFIPPDPQPGDAKLADKCEHRDRPEKARGLCSVCYRAALKAEQAAKLLERSNNPDKLARDLELEWDKDPQLKKRFGQIMWSWMEEGETIDPIYVMRDGRKERDYKTELALREIAAKRQDKAATVLGRAYVTEKVEEVKPQPLPIGGAVDASGWLPGGRRRK